MPSALNVPVPPTAITLSFGGVDFRLDPDALSSPDATQVLLQRKDNGMVLNLTSFTGTLRVAFSSLSDEPSNKAPHVSSTSTAKVEEEPPSPAATMMPPTLAQVSPGQRQLPFSKAKTVTEPRLTKKNAKVSKTPEGSKHSMTVPAKPRKAERQNKRSNPDLQKNLMTSTHKKKKVARPLDDSSMLCQNTSQLSQMVSSQNTSVGCTQGESMTDVAHSILMQNDDERSIISSETVSQNREANTIMEVDENEEDNEQSGLVSDAVNMDASILTPTKRQPPPSPRWGHSMTRIDGNRILVYGGQGVDTATGEPHILSDLHVYDMSLHKWYKPINCDGVPRQWHSATYLPERQLLISFGGETKHPKTGRTSTTDQVMVLDTEIMLWYPPSVSGTVPSGRSGHTATMLPSTNELVVFGGVKGNKWQNSVAVLDVTRWIWSSPKIMGNAPRPRSYHSATAVNGTGGKNRLVIFGGNDHSASFDTVHVLETDGKMWNWINPVVTGHVPPVRTGHCATLLADQKTISIYGGWDPNADAEVGTNDEEMIFGDSYLLDTETWTWSMGPKPVFVGDGVSLRDSLASDGGERRVGHKSVLGDGDGTSEVLVFGGRIPNDRFACDFQSLTVL